MILNLYSFSVGGKDFSPAKAEAQLGISFQFKIEKGEIWKRTGLVADQGCGMFTGFRDPGSLLKIIESVLQGFRRLGAEDFDLRLEVLHDGQCNFELEHDLLARVSRLGLKISISAYLDEAAFQSTTHNTVNAT